MYLRLLCLWEWKEPEGYFVAERIGLTSQSGEAFQRMVLEKEVLYYFRSLRNSRKSEKFVLSCLKFLDITITDGVGQNNIRQCSFDNFDYYHFIMIILQKMSLFCTENNRNSSLYRNSLCSVRRQRSFICYPE